MPPKHAGVKESWDEWFEGWKLWFKQVGMNCWYGRGGLNVKVRCVFFSSHYHSIAPNRLSEEKSEGSLHKCLHERGLC